MLRLINVSGRHICYFRMALTLSDMFKIHRNNLIIPRTI